MAAKIGHDRTEVAEEDKDAEIAQLRRELSEARAEAWACFADIEVPLRSLVLAFNSVSAALRPGAHEELWPVVAPASPASPRRQSRAATSPSTAPSEASPFPSPSRDGFPDVTWQPLPPASCSQRSEPPTALCFVVNPHAGMMGDVFWLPRVQALVAEANSILGWNVEKYCKNAAEQALVRNARRTLPACFVASVAAMEKLRILDVAQPPDAIACSNSSVLGAMYAAGVIDLEVGLNLATTLSDSIYRAIENNPQATVFVQGLTRPEVEGICKEAVRKDKTTRSPICKLTASLGPRAFSCGGSLAAIEALRELAKQAGADFVENQQKYAEGTPMMQPIVTDLSNAFKSLMPKLKAPTCTMYFSNSDAKVAAGTSPKELVKVVEANLIAENRLERCCRTMIADGIQRFLEVGPARGSTNGITSEDIAKRTMAFIV